MKSQERDGGTMKKMGFRCCRKTARDTGVWKLILKEAKAVSVQYSQRRRIYTVQYECKTWFLHPRLRIWEYYKVKITVI